MVINICGYWFAVNSHTLQVKPGSLIGKVIAFIRCILRVVSCGVFGTGHWIATATDTSIYTAHGHGMIELSEVTQSGSAGTDSAGTGSGGGSGGGTV